MSRKFLVTITIEEVPRMPRYVFGPALATPFVEQGDVQITIDGPAARQPDGSVTVPITVPPHDTAVSKLTKVFLVFAPAAPASTDTAQGFVEDPSHHVGGLVYDADGSAAVPLSIPVQGVPRGSWFGQTVLEFES